MTGWEYDRLEGGGDRWRLMLDGVCLGCVVRLPGTLYRVYSGEFGGSFTTAREATELLAARHGFAELEAAPCL
jgi:hypothetical protein